MHQIRHTFTFVFGFFIALLTANTATSQTAEIPRLEQSFPTIVAAMEAAVDGDSIVLSSGTFTLETTLVIDKSVSLIGAGMDLTTIDVGGFDGVGIYVPASLVTVKGVRVESDAAVNSLEAVQVGTGNSAEGTPTTHFINEGFHIENAVIAGSNNSALAFNGVQNALVKNVSLQGSVAGFGLSIASSAGIAIESLTTANNAWGGVGIFPANNSEAFAQIEAPTGIAFSGTNSFGEGIHAISVQNGTLSDGSTWSGTISNDPNASADVTVPAAMSKLVHYLPASGVQTQAPANGESAHADAQNLVEQQGGSAFSNVVVENLENGELEVSLGLSIQDAIDFAAVGDVVTVLGNTYPLSSTIDVNKAITFQGKGQENTIFSCNGSVAGGYCLKVTASGATLQNFTVDGGDQGSVFGIHVQPNTSNTTLQSITARDCAQNGISFTGTNDAEGRNIVTDITVTGNGLLGIGFGASQHVTVSNITGSDNTGGDIGMYIGSWDEQRNDDLVFEEPLNLAGGISFTIEEDDPAGFEIVASTSDETDALYDEDANVFVPSGWNRLVHVNVPAIPGFSGAFTSHTFAKQATAPVLAGLLASQAGFSGIATLNLESGEWEVSPGMEIQAAIDRAAIGDVVTLLDGTHAVTETVDVDKAIQVQGASESGTIMDGSTLAEGQPYALKVTASGATIQDLTVDGGASKTPVFGIHVQPGTSNTTLQGITATNCSQNGISFTGTNDDEGRNYVSDITVTNNGLVGLGFGASQNVTISDVTSSGNASGDIGIYIGDYEGQRNDDLVFEEPLNLSAGISYTIEANDPVGFEVVASTADATDALYNAEAHVFVPSDWDQLLYADFGGDPTGTPFIPVLTNHILTKQAVLAPLALGVASIPGISNVAARDLSKGDWVVEPGMSAQAAIDRAEEGDDVLLRNGAHTIATTINVNKAIALSGETESGAVLDGESLTAGNTYVLKVTASGASLQSFTVDGGAARTPVFGIHVQPLTSNTTITGITAKNCSQNGLSLTGTTDADGRTTISDVELTGNGLFGLGIGASQHVTVSDVTAHSNDSGDIGVYIGSYMAQPNDDLVFEEPLNITTGIAWSDIDGMPETFGVTYSTTNAQDALYNAAPTIQVPAAWNRLLMADVEADLSASPPIPALTAMTLITPDMVDGLVALQSAVPGLSDLAMRNLSTGNWEVPTGLSIQAAANRAASGETIDLGAGSFNESVTTSTALTIAGSTEGSTVTAADGQTYAFVLAAGLDATNRTVLDGFTISNGTNGVSAGSFTTLQNMSISGHSGNGMDIRDAEDVVVSSSTFSANTNGVSVLADAAVSGLAIETSTFANQSDAGVVFPADASAPAALSSVSISNNSFDGNATGVRVHRLDNSTIEANAFTNTATGVELALQNGNFDGISIVRNTFGDDTSGLEVHVQPTSLTNLVVEENYFTSSAVGIQFGEAESSDALPASMSVVSNHFSDLNGPAVYNALGSELSLTCNWLGAGQVAGIQPLLSPTVDVQTILISGEDADATTPGFQPEADAACVDFGGCAIPGACNYDASATVLFPLVSDCDFESCAGCTDSTACNFSDEATISDNSLCTYPAAENLDCAGDCLNDADEDGVCDEDEVSGCADDSACNYVPESYTEADNTLCSYPEEGYDCDGDCLVDTDGDGVCDPFEVLGCTDDGACNFNEAATNDDSSCNYTTCAGCTVITACTYDATATISDPTQCEYPTEDYLDCDGNCTNDTDGDGICDEVEVPGCEDSDACNYDEDATDSDGSCTYPETHYDCNGDCLQDSDGDGVCNALEVPGCTIVTACNYDENATQLDGSCNFTGCQGCMIEQACNYDPTATVAINAMCQWAESPFEDCGGTCLNDTNTNGICDEEEVPGCMDITATNYDPDANVDEGCIAAVAGCLIPSACNYDANATVMDIADCDFDSCNPPVTAGLPITPVSGCTDQYACNYDLNATTDDGSCEYTSCIGCTNPAGCDYDADFLYNGGCDYTCYGCTDSNAVNFDPAATLDDGSCLVFNYGCTIPSACNYDSTATINDYSCEYTSCLGCLELDACNYDATATLNNLGSCDYPDEGYDCYGDCLLDADNDFVCDPFEIPGCSDPTACNYDATATDPATCTFPAAYYDCDGVCLADDDGDGVCNELEVLGCTYAGACNYSAAATEDNGSCEFVSCVGCMDSTACNYDGTATLNDPVACNYPATGYDCFGNCLADADNDGTCDPFEIDGCTDSNACNYSASATEEDGTCTYPVDVHGVAYVDCSGACLNDADNDGVCDEVEIDGCMDAGACNYDSTATDDTGCEYLTCAGCSIPAACNYSPNEAIINNIVCEFADPGFDCDGNCIDINMNQTCDSEEPTVIGCFDSTACNYNAGTNVINNTLCIYPQVACDSCSGATDGTGYVVDGDADDDLVCDDDEVTGCSDSSACNYNVNATDPPAPGEECVYTSAPCDTCSGANDGTGYVVDGDPDNDGICAPFEITGCQDPAACNYNTAATDPPAAGQECAYPTAPCDVCSGLTDGTGFVVDGDVDGDGICNTAETTGCVYAGACNYNANATEDDGSCVFPVGCETCSGETDGTGTVVDNDTDNDGVCNANEISGCLDSTACNYNQYATDDANNCVYASGCDACAGGNSGDGYVADGDADDDGVCDVDEIPGCTAATACNYNAAATDDDGSCVFADDLCETCNASGGVDLSDADGDGVCDAAEVAGCQVAEACNYNAAATDPGACAFATGCDACSGETNGTGTIVDGDQNANGICDASEVPGCMDSGACNYNASANVPSGNCLFAGSCQSCSGATDGTGTVVDQDDDNDGVCNADEVLGCLDAGACNYNADATEDAQNCIFASEACEMCMDGAVVLLDVDSDGICDTDEPLGCVGDESAPVFVMDSLVVVDAPVADWGQMDFIDDILDAASVSLTFSDLPSMASNGTYQVTRLYRAEDACGLVSHAGQVLQAASTLPSGCTYDGASNYDPAAVNNDGSCFFASDCPTDLNYDGVTGTSDLLFILSSFGAICD